MVYNMKTIDEELDSVFRNKRQKAVINLKYTANWISNLHNDYMKDYDLSMAQFNILRILRGGKDYLNIHTVKDRMIEKSPNTTRLMDKLLEKGLIKRKRCKDDRRVVFVKISDKGLDLLSKIDETFTHQFFNAEHLTEEEAEQLSHLLDKMRSE